MLDDYLRNATVAKFVSNTNLKDVTNVYGFRRESPINNCEGYVKYYLNRKKGRFIYFSYEDIYNLMGFNAAERFIEKVERIVENEECSIRRTITSLKQSSLYKKCKLFTKKRLQMTINEEYMDNNDCFYKAIEKLAGSKLKYKVQIKTKLRVGDVDQQIALVNKSELGFLIAENNIQRGVLATIVGSILNKSIVVFSVNNFKTHTIIVEAGVPCTDPVFYDFENEEVEATIYDVFYD